jgi:hypothetical protein
MYRATDLSRLHDEIVTGVTRQGLLVFPGYISDELPAVWWQGGSEDWQEFLRIGKAEGARTVCVSRTVLEEEDLQEVAEWVEERTGPGSTNGDRARLKEFERYLGYTGEIRLGWVRDGVAYLFQVRTDWYEDFLELMAEAEGEGLDELDHAD